jgi:hypothetical protein
LGEREGKPQGEKLVGELTLVDVKLIVTSSFS